MTQLISRLFRRLRGYWTEQSIGRVLWQHRLWVLHQEVDGKQADFSDRDLTGHTLLMMADLRRAILCRAKLQFLFKTDLTHADLTDADIRNGILIETNLNGARLDIVDFTGATFGSTVLANVDLPNCKGLNAVTHSSPSSLGIDTLFKSKGKIPKEF